MPFTARVFRNLESEINRHLSFTFAVVGGSHEASRRAKFTACVMISNNSTISMKNVRGSILPVVPGTFRAVRFDLETLAPREQREIARIEIARSGNGVRDLDQVATVNVAGQADLSDFWFRDSSRALTYVQAPINVDPFEITRHPAHDRENARRRDIEALRPLTGES